MIDKSIAIHGCIAVLLLAQFIGIIGSDSSLETGTAPETQDETMGELRTEPAQNVGRNRNGLYEMVTPRLTLISDIPIDDELKSWPGLIEQSIEQWQHYFGVDSKRMERLHITAMLIGDRERLAKLGMLNNVPGFDEGYQYGSKIYLREQPTAYFRRHLFLHEATHWIMWELYGGGGSPWFMEGMAEMQGTHSLKDGILQLGVIPSSREQVSGWGRLRMIDETLKRGEAPSMSQILAYGNDRTDHVIRYSWSWAACVFFTNHPKYGPMLRDLYKTKLDYSDSLSLRLKDRLAADWQDMLVDWNAFVSDLDFGYDLQRSSVVHHAGPPTRKLKEGDSVNLQLATERGWQSTGIVLAVGQSIRVACTGRYSLKNISGQSDANWDVEPNGITYQYYRGNPLGCVIASVVSPIKSEQTKRWETIRIGSGTMLEPEKGGELFLKTNQPSSGLSNNLGLVSVQISVVIP